jgi:alanine racemase
VSSELVSEPKAAIHRPVEARIDLDAFGANVALMGKIAAPAALMVVVKANAYGHGAFPIASRAIGAGATAVAVSVVDEASDLRSEGFFGEILVLTEPDEEGFAAAVALDVACTVASSAGVRAATKAAHGARRRLRLHLKVDTGMHRLGADLDEAVALATAIATADVLELEGVFTHLAVADEVENPFTDVQLDRLDSVLAKLAASDIVPRYVHAANSAGAIAHPAARRDLVRVGIACYGSLPSPELAGVFAEQLGTGEKLRPVLSLVAKVQSIRYLKAGERTSYGQRYQLQGDSTVVTVPIGYADGLPRALGSSGGEVLIGGRRCRIAGTVTMDQIVVDVGAGEDVGVGSDVVLIGSQGDEEITAWEWAEKCDTIAYEVLSRLGPRVPRRLA